MKARALLVATPALAALAVLLVPASAFASGADDLMKAASPTTATQGNATTHAQNAPLGVEAMNASEFKLGDAFALNFFNTWNRAELGTHLPYDVNAWARLVLKGRYEDAAHLWTSIQPQMPDTFRTAALSAQLYCLWKLSLGQTFFDRWLDAIRAPAFRESLDNLTLEQTFSPRFDHWMLDRAIVLNPDQKQFISGLDASHGALDATLRAYAALRGGQAALSLLPLLPADHALKVPLAETATLALAREGDLGHAARILKDDLEPALALEKNPKRLAEHYIEIARLLYQAGSLDGAEQYYEKVPSGIPAYLSAREELMWVWLRKGDISRLRGELAGLSSPIFADRFSPELDLVKAISNLKLCYYDEVAKSFQDFIRSNSVWAHRISEAEKSSDPTAAPPESEDEGDFYTRFMDRAYSNLRSEAAQLDGLETRSVGAALPSVGPQLHWKTARHDIQALLETVKKQRTDEYHRQWRNRQQILAAAMLKMKFVRVEYLSEIQLLADRSADRSADQIRVSSAAPLSEAAPAKKELTSLDSGPEQMVFPFDGTFWADEVLRLRSVAHGRCPGQ